MIRVSSTEGDPVLWHIPVSHYNEKARWALDFKGVRATRKAPPPGAHMVVALWLTRGSGKTFPLLQLDGRAIGDSTEIIAALEARYPNPPLYPSDPGRARPGPGDRGLLRRGARTLCPPAGLSRDPARRAEPQAVHRRHPPGAAGPQRPRRHRRRRRARRRSPRPAIGSPPTTWPRTPRRRILGSLDRLEADLDAGGGDYLVGDRFSVADLTAASLFGPVVSPPEGPELPDPPPAYEEFRAPLRERRGFRWVEEMFSRHRQDAVRPLTAPASCSTSTNRGIRGRP